MKQYTHAAEAWAEAEEAFPERTDYALRRAEALFQAGQTEPAKMLMWEVLRNHPDQKQTREFLVACALVAGDVKGAIALLEEGLPSARNSADLLVRLASLYMGEGELELASQRSTKRWQLTPIMLRRCSRRPRYCKS